MLETVYIFDADGVINGLHTYTTDERVIAQIADLLNSGCHVAINTGRGYPWVRDNVIAGVHAKAVDDKLDNLFVSAEMGGVTVEFVGGKEQDNRSAFSLRPDQMQRVEALYHQIAEDKNMGLYEGKVSMSTIDKPANVSLEDFVVPAQEVAAQLRELFKDEHVKVNVTADAIDVTTPEAGKWAGAQLIYDWLRRTPAARAEQYICFGDNPPDYEMARFFAQHASNVEFVFTGENLGTIEHDPKVTLTVPSVPYSDGTYEFLQARLNSSA